MSVAATMDSATESFGVNRNDLDVMTAVNWAFGAWTAVSMALMFTGAGTAVGAGMLVVGGALRVGARAIIKRLVGRTAQRATTGAQKAFQKGSKELTEGSVERAAKRTGANVTKTRVGRGSTTKRQAGRAAGKGRLKTTKPRARGQRARRFVGRNGRRLGLGLAQAGKALMKMVGLAGLMAALNGISNKVAARQREAKFGNQEEMRAGASALNRGVTISTTAEQDAERQQEEEEQDKDVDEAKPKTDRPRQSAQGGSGLGATA